MSEITNSLLELSQGSSIVDIGSDTIPAILEKNCCYIVSAVLLVEEKVLLISEAKHTCYGKWYLPAGRVEQNETLVDAFKRELLEESFLEGDPDYLFNIDWTPFHRWFRFNFLGHVTGGRLKTLGDADKESLEARWFPVTKVFNKEIDLRCTDIIEVIRSAVNWKTGNNALMKERSLPRHIAHHCMCQRIFLIDNLSSPQSLKIKVAQCKESGNYPVTQLSYSIKKKCTEFFSKQNVDVTVLGLISIEHFPKNKNEGDFSDGICFNVLCLLNGESDSSLYDWIEVNVQLANKIKNVIKSSSFIMVNKEY